MSHSPTGPQHLIHMANDIGHFFAAACDNEAAIIGIADHMKRFWTPSMRRKLITELPTGESDERLDDLPWQALRLLREHPDFRSTSRSQVQRPVAGVTGERLADHNLS